MATQQPASATYKLVTRAVLDQIRSLASRMLAVPTALQNPAAATSTSAVEVDHAATTQPSFKFCTWNVLAQMLIKRELYPTSSKQALSEKYRREMHRAWIQALDADLLCLQETDKEALHWAPLLRESGYEFTSASFKPGRHGVMVVWRASMWKVNRAQRVSLDQHPNDPSAGEDAEIVDGEPKVYGATRNVGLVVELEHLATGRRVVCATAHLYWIPRGTYIRLRQHAVMMDAVQAFNVGKNPVIYAGDFNSLTDRTEYAVLTHRPLTADHLADLHDIPSVEESRSLPDLALRTSITKSAHYDFDAVPDVSPTKLVDLFNHWPTFYSAYAQYVQSDPTYSPRDDALNEPRWTTKTSSFSGTLDYVFLVDPAQSRSAVNEKKGDEFPWRVMELLAMIPDELAAAGLPNDVCPSDHVPLAANLTLV
ncbi:Endonuclease/exonuclease/phosphatase [Catenaria anguillulae PL171]|uniref:Endonuclease/exonuclease/phosphatase n=1 Tax=Catenaria anguillulae PL171 TaxID=765915 RepID=A0A1Y2I3G7_9FUNG|nr:Endonuclease/exonuclease/phosphatase [Catenaria anguillulae PL171]